MARTHVVVEITPSRLEAVVFRSGRPVATRVERYGVAAPSDQFAELLESRAPTLAKWVSELGAQGAPTSVLYWSGSGACGVFSCPASAGEAGIEQAPRLAVAELAGMPLAEGICDVQRAFADTAADSGDKPAQVHALAAIDREQTTLMLVDWLSKAGLIADRIVPVTAPALLHVVRTVTSNGTSRGTQVALWFDEHQSILAAGGAGRLVFLRVLNIGVESLVDALSRPIRCGTGDTPPVTLDRAEIRRLLAHNGIPTPDDQFDAAHQIAGTSVLPLVQPVLQRFAVEVKQSLRFSLSDNERSGVNISVIGPGAGVRRLAEVLGQQCGTPATAAAIPVVPTELSSSTLGAISAWVAVGELELNLLPPSLARSGTVQLVRRGLWAGLGAAAALLTLTAVMDFVKLSHLKQEVAQLETRAGELTQATAERSAALAMRDNAVGMERRAFEQLGDSTAWSALVSAVAEVTPPEIKLNNLEQITEDSGFACRLVGTAQAEGEASFAALVARYNHGLAGIPIVRNVRMGSTNRSQTAGRETYRFEMTLSVRPVMCVRGTEQGGAQ